MFVEGKKTLVSYVPGAAVAGGVMWLLSLLLPFLISAEQGSGADYRITNVPLFSLYVAMGTVAFLLFPIAVSGLRLRAARQTMPVGSAGKFGEILVWFGALLVAAPTHIHLILKCHLADCLHRNAKTKNRPVGLAI